MRPSLTSRALRSVVLLFVGGLVPSGSGAQAATPFQAAAFDRVDREAQSLLSMARCARSTAMARADGLFGPADSLGRSGHCLRVGGRWVSVFMATDSAGERAVRLAAVDLATRARYTAALDTSALLALDRAELDAQHRGADAYVKAERPYAPMSFTFDGDSVEVWLVPGTNFRGSSVGGERGYVYSPNGRTLARTIDHFGDYRPVTIPDTGTVRIGSQQDALPTFSELLLANVLHSAGRDISIDMRRVTSALAGQPADAPWVQLTH